MPVMSANVQMIVWSNIQKWCVHRGFHNDESKEENDIYIQHVCPETQNCLILSENITKTCPCNI